MERFAERYPDVTADDEEAFYGRLGDEWDRMDRSDAAQRELGELLANDPRSAGFLMVMRKGGNPMEYLIEQYGDDFREALNDETKAKEFSAAFSKYAEKQAKNKELQAQAEANMQRMLDDLDAAKAEGSFTDDDAAKAYAYLYGDEMAAMQNYPCVGLPYCAGYACGYHLVKHYLKKTGKSIIEATLLPASEILETVEDFWNE